VFFFAALEHIFCGRHGPRRSDPLGDRAFSSECSLLQGSSSARSRFISFLQDKVGTISLDHLLPSLGRWLLKKVLVIFPPFVPSSSGLTGLSPCCIVAPCAFFCIKSFAAPLAFPDIAFFTKSPFGFLPLQTWSSTTCWKGDPFSFPLSVFILCYFFFPLRDRPFALNPQSLVLRFVGSCNFPLFPPVNGIFFSPFFISLPC